jgi:hypothetical protein
MCVHVGGPSPTSRSSDAPRGQVIDQERERHSFVFFFYPSFDAAIPSLPRAATGEAAAGCGEQLEAAQSRYSLLASQVLSPARSPAPATPPSFLPFIVPPS